MSPNKNKNNKSMTSSSRVSGDYWSKFATELVNLVEISIGDKVLDVGTGWGATLQAIIRKVGPTGVIFGIDVHKETIPEAKKIIERENIHNANLRVMNANSMDFTDESFDRVVCGFIGFSNVYDFETNTFRQDNRKMEEIYRVLKIGGAVGFSSWAYQEDIEVLEPIIRDYLSKIDSITVINPFPKGYSKEKIQGFENMMRMAGFQDIKIMIKEYSMIYPDIESWWRNIQFVGDYILKKTIGLEDKSINEFRMKMLPWSLEKNKCSEGYCFQKSVIFALGSKSNV